MYFNVNLECKVQVQEDGVLVLISELCKGKGYPRTGHERPRGSIGIALLFP
jgi:hypothetical protein